ncbi:MAG TPA: tetratricopeptide repeat protein, partial [Blastocatellia bacterium]|nr:tetratricopeptide repeat protein [Blastocatellia bacterium]
SREISEKLRLRLTGAQKKQLRKRHTDNTEAYQLYLKGRFCWNKRTIEALKQGIEYFERAISTDPNYALSYTGLADSYNILASYSALAPNEAFPVAKSAALKALELDDKLAEAHTSLAFVRLGYDWDWAESEREFRQAIELNPGYPTGHLWYALMLASQGRFEEAMREIRQAESLDPFSLPIVTNVGWILHLARRYDEAVTQYHKVLDMDSNFVLARRRLGQVYKQKLMFDEAIEVLQSTLPLSDEDTETVASLGHAYALSGRTEEARRVLDAMMALSSQRYIPAYFISSIYMGLGEKDRAFEWLEKACEERYGFLAYLNVEPSFDCLRFDPRFVALARRIGLNP